MNLAQVYAGIEFLRLINWKVAWAATPRTALAGGCFGYEGVRDRVLSRRVPASDGDPRTARLPAGGSPEAVADGRIEHLYRGMMPMTFGGGVNEIQRDLIATFGLGMPRTGRKA